LVNFGPGTVSSSSDVSMQVFPLVVIAITGKVKIKSLVVKIFIKHGIEDAERMIFQVFF